jgi:hypothetical protein
MYTHTHAHTQHTHTHTHKPTHTQDYIIEEVEHAVLTVGRSQTMLLPRHHNEYPLIDQV